jgi:hypothetical protein
MVTTSAKSPQTASTKVCSGTIVTAIIGFRAVSPVDSAPTGPLVPQLKRLRMLKTSKQTSVMSLSRFIFLSTFTIDVANANHSQQPL